MVGYTYHGPAIWPYDELERWNSTGQTSTSGGVTVVSYTNNDGVGQSGVSGTTSTDGFFFSKNATGLTFVGGLSVAESGAFNNYSNEGEGTGTGSSNRTQILGNGFQEVSEVGTRAFTTTAVSGGSTVTITNGQVVISWTHIEMAYDEVGITFFGSDGETVASGGGAFTNDTPGTTSSSTRQALLWAINDETTTWSSVMGGTTFIPLSNFDFDTSSIGIAPNVTLTYAAYTTTAVTATEMVPTTTGGGDAATTNRTYTSTAITHTGTGTYSRKIVSNFDVFPDAVPPYLTTIVWVMEGGDTVANMLPGSRLIPFECGLSWSASPEYAVPFGKTGDITQTMTASTTRIDQSGFDLDGSLSLSAGQTHVFTQPWTSATGSGWSATTTQTVSWTDTFQSAPGASTTFSTNTRSAGNSQIWTTLMCVPQDNWLATGDSSSGMSSYVTSFNGPPFYAFTHTNISDQLTHTTATTLVGTVTEITTATTSPTFTWWNNMTSTSTVTVGVIDGVPGVITTGWIYPVVRGASVTYENSAGTVMTSDYDGSPLELQPTALTITARIPQPITMTVLTMYALAAGQQGASFTNTSVQATTGDATEGWTTSTFGAQNGVTNTYWNYYSYALGTFLDSQQSGAPDALNWQRAFGGEDFLCVSLAGRGYRPLVTSSDTRRFGWISIAYETSVLCWSTNSAGTTTSTACNFGIVASFNTDQPQYSWFGGNGVTTSWNLNEGASDDTGTGTWETGTFDTINLVDFSSQMDAPRMLWMLEAPGGFWLPFTLLSATTTDLEVLVNPTLTTSSVVTITVNGSYTADGTTAFLFNITDTSAQIAIYVGTGSVLSAVANYHGSIYLSDLQSVTGAGSYWTFLHEDADNTLFDWFDDAGLSTNPPWQMGWPQTVMTDDTVMVTPGNTTGTGGLYADKTYEWTVAPLTTIIGNGRTMQIGAGHRGFVTVNDTGGTGTATSSPGDSADGTARTIFNPASVFYNNVRYPNGDNGQLSTTARVWNDDPDDEQPEFINPIT